MTKKELKALIKEVISEVSNESIEVKTILSKLRSTQDDVRGINVSETKYYGPGEEEWIKKYDQGFGVFLVLPKNSNVEYYSASIIPLNKEMTFFDLNINYEKFQGRGKQDLKFKNLDINKVTRTLKFYKD